MANVYVYSGAAGAGTGADWTNAYTTLAAAFTAKAAGDDFWVAHDHAESSASAQALTSPGTASSPCRVICVNRSGSVPPVSADLRTTGSVTTTGNNAITFLGFAYCYGIIFNAGTGVVGAALTISSASTSVWSMDGCALNKLGTSATSAAILIGTASANVGSMVTLHNTTVKFGAIGDGMTVRGCEFIWRNTPSAIQGATLPTTLFAGTVKANVLLEGVDLSALASGNTIVGALIASSNYVAKDCKLGASVTIAATPSNPGPKVSVVRCDSGDTNYRTERYAYEGTLTTETTIVRTGGASDGTTPIAWKIITTANSKRYLPFDALPISIWNETTGSPITLTVQGIWGGGAVPTDANIWMDVEYLGTSGVPLGSFATSGAADQLAAGTNLSAGSGTWGGSTTKFTLTKQITPQEKGPITVYVRAALASSTFYIDPKITVT